MSAFSDAMREWTSSALFPLVRLLNRANISPNAITLTGAGSYILIAVALALGHGLLAGVLIAILGPLDLIDGLLARTTGKKTAFGAFLDSTMDRYAEFFLFIGLIFYFLRNNGLDPITFIAIFSAMTGSIMVSYARARAEALGFSCKVGLFTRFERLFLLASSLILGFEHIALLILAILTHFTAVHRIIHVWKQADRCPR